MVDRIRDFFRNEHIGITIPVGVVAGLALSELLFHVSAAFLVPLLQETPLGDEGFPAFGLAGLDFSIGDVTFDYTQIVNYGFTVLALVAFAWFLFVRPTRAELAAAEEDDGMRECPECKSEIVAEATRCAFCTAQITPITIA
jgi:large conductance mechanosensitive channel